jgi:hypothetical protein
VNENYDRKSKRVSKLNYELMIDKYYYIWLSRHKTKTQQKKNSMSWFIIKTVCEYFFLFGSMHSVLFHNKFILLSFLWGYVRIACHVMCLLLFYWELNGEEVERRKTMRFLSISFLVLSLENHHVLPVLVHNTRTNLF